MLGSTLASRTAPYSGIVGKPQQLGTVIRAAREGAGMTQQTLAYLARTTVDAVSGIENGTRVPRWDTLARIMAVLRLRGAELEGPIDYEVRERSG